MPNPVTPEVKRALLYLVRGEQPLCSLSTKQDLLEKGFIRWGPMQTSLEITIDGLWAVTGYRKSILIGLLLLREEELQ